MKLTKYTHACVVLEEQGSKLVIDPGTFTKEFGPLDTIAGVVVTHNHGDHLDKSHLDAIVAVNPEVRIFTTADTAEKLPGMTVETVTGGGQAEAGPFKLRFFGQKHAEIYPGHITVPENVGVLVNESVYYPGDSFEKPDVTVRTLLAPVSAPWLKIGETMGFVEDLKPGVCIATHNGLLNSAGVGIVKNLLRSISDKHGVQFTYLDDGESLEA